MRRILGSVAVGALTVALVPAPSWAVTDTWSDWGAIEGTSTSYTTVMEQRSPGFPRAQVSTDSRSSVQVASGASVFLGAGTPPGAKYGSSRNQPYLVLRARADTPTTPSTTTYAFERPTPDTGWAFVLGDIDADQVQVSATDAQGRTVPAARVDSWFAGTFNHAGAADLPTWQPATSTLLGSPDARDTDGASGWFEPDIRLSSLTLTFTRRAGFPVYQTWFVSRARPIGGSIADTSTGAPCPVEESLVTLVSPSGETLATTRPDVSGAFELGEFATQSDYTVRVEAPDGCVVLGPAERTVSNRGEDGDEASRAAFTMRVIVPQPISGRVTDEAGEPVAGVEVTVTRPNGTTASTTTDASGRYLFDENPIGTDYTVSVVPPAGYGPGPDGTAITGVEIDDDPVTDQDFVVVSLPNVSGTVTAAGEPLAGVPVTLTSADGSVAVSAVTGADGSYDFPRVPAGTYTVAIRPPAGYVGSLSREVTVTEDDVTDQDFALSRVGSIAGRVTLDGSPVDAAEIRVEGPAGVATVRTDADGRYLADALPAGSYRVTVVPAPGTTTVGTGSLLVVVTEAGEAIEEQDFVLASAGTTPTPAPEPSDDSPGPGGTPEDDAPGSGTGTSTAGGNGLAVAGGPAIMWGALGLAALMAGGGAVLGSRRR